MFSIASTGVGPRARPTSMGLFVVGGVRRTELVSVGVGVRLELPGLFIPLSGFKVVFWGGEELLPLPPPVPGVEGALQVPPGVLRALAGKPKGCTGGRETRVRPLAPLGGFAGFAGFVGGVARPGLELPQRRHAPPSSLCLEKEQYRTRVAHFVWVPRL